MGSKISVQIERALLGKPSDEGSPRLATSKIVNSDGCGGSWMLLKGKQNLGSGGPIRTEYTIFEHTLPQRTDPFRRASLRTKRLHARFRLAGNPGGQPSR
jgi:hypothetical protein